MGSFFGHSYWFSDMKICLGMSLVMIKELKNYFFIFCWERKILKQNHLQTIFSQHWKFEIHIQCTNLSEHLNSFWDKTLTMPIDITFTIFVKDLSFARSILESLLTFLKFLMPCKDRSYSKSKNLIQYKDKNKTNLKLKGNF